MKRCLAFVGLVSFIMLMGAILHLQKSPGAPSKSHFTSPELTYAKMDLPHPATNGGFLDDINLSLDPSVTIHDPDTNHASLNFQSDLPSGRFDELQPRPGNTPKRALTVADRQLNYELLDLNGFALKLNLKPAYSNPEAAIPSSLDPGFGISLKF
jgi:hypothetical protein